MRGGKRLLPAARVILLILAGLLVYQYGYLGLQTEIEAARDAAAIRMKTLQKYVTFAAQKPQLEEKLAALREKRKAEGSRMIEGQTGTLAAASLQNTIKTLITARGWTVSSERIEKQEKLGQLSVISVSIDGQVPDTRALNEALYAIETQTPYLTVRELDVRLKDFKDPRELMVRMKISGITEGK